MKQHVPTLYILATAAALTLAGCAETLDTHGQIILPSRLAQIKVGETTQEQVLQLLGSPSTQGTLNDTRWYYITSTVGTKAFNPNDLKSRKVVVIDFDPSSTIVRKMTDLNESSGRPIDPDRTKTTTQGQSMGFIEQMFGNIGMGPK
jgi:outer membrane protein assembly factor BamE (lipoprotein component of BamABCDE complex)